MPIRTHPLTPQYGWNEAANRYTNLLTGRFVAGAQVRGALETVISASGSNIEALSRRFVDGELSLAEWRSGMLREVKLVNTAAAAAANGGWAQMSASDWGAAGSLVKKQYRFLENFARQVASGKQPINGRLVARAKLYAQAARGTYQEMRRRKMTGKGFTEECRVLGYAEHCTGCVAQADKGWLPIGTLPPLGSQECVTNCACHFEYRRPGADGREVYADAD